MSNQVLVQTGSPFIYLWNGNGNQGIAFTNNDSTKHFSIDPTAGSNSASTSKGIAVDTSDGLGDVSAATLSGNTYYVYLASSGNYQIVASPNGGTSLGTPASLGISGVSNSFTPTLVTYSGKLFAAYVDSSNFVHLASSSTGTSWTILGQVSSTTTVSRPALAVYGNDLVLGFTGPNTSNRQPQIGPVATSGTYNARVTAQPGGYGNSHRNSVYAGIALVTHGGSLYTIGQYSGSGQFMMSSETTNDTSFPAPTTCNAYQLRWTPSAVQTSSGSTWIVAQDDSDTDIDLYKSN